VAGTRHGLSCPVLARNAARLPFTAARRASAGRGRAGCTAARRTCAGSARGSRHAQGAVLFRRRYGSLLSHFVSAVRGSLYRKASFLLDKLGEPVSRRSASTNSRI
jgi:hypothetical protein